MDILVVVAHPDDEVLGCGATIAKHVSQNDNVRLLVMADGVGARNYSESDDLVERNQALADSCRLLGVSQYDCLGLADNKLDQYPLLEVIKSAEKVLGDYQPDLIYTHHKSDLNVDHRITLAVVMTLFRPLPKSKVKEIRTFEVLSSTHWGSDEFNPNLFVDVTKFKEKKIAAIKCYDTEMRDSPHARSFEAIESQLSFRGHVVGKKYAEAFCIERKIE